MVFFKNKRTILYLIFSKVLGSGKNLYSIKTF